MFYLNNSYKIIIYFCFSILLISSLHFFISWYDYYYYILNILFNNVGVLNIVYLLSLDNISVIFIIITLFLLILCLVLNWYNIYKENILNFLMVVILVILINVFLVNDLLYFFIFFEALVIPMFLLIGI